jgi:hypothetical protein
MKLETKGSGTRDYFNLSLKLVANSRSPMVVTTIMVEMDKIWHSETREELTSCFDFLKEVCNI